MQKRLYGIEHDADKRLLMGDDLKILQIVFTEIRYYKQKDATMVLSLQE